MHTGPHAKGYWNQNLMAGGCMLGQTRSLKIYNILVFIFHRAAVYSTQIPVIWATGALQLQYSYFVFMFLILLFLINTKKTACLFLESTIILENPQLWCHKRTCLVAWLRVISLQGTGLITGLIIINTVFFFTRSHSSTLVLLVVLSSSKFLEFS